MCVQEPTSSNTPGAGSTGSDDGDAASHAGSRGANRSGGRALRKALFVLLGFVVLFETVPRFVDIPGLEPDLLNPAYAADSSARAFLPHPYLIFTPKPDWERDDEKLQRSHGDRGFRGVSIPVAKPEGTLRIACVGGSSTYGTGPTADEFAWPSRLASILNESDSSRPVDVLNAGAPSWNSFECLGNLAFRVLPFSPDIVVIYLATNDAESALWPNPTADNTHYRVGWQNSIPSPLEAGLEKSILYLTWRKYATDHLEQRARLDRYTGKVVPPGPVGEALQSLRVPPELSNPGDQGFVSFQRNLVSMIAVARAHGAVPVLMTQALWSPDPESDHLYHGKVRLAAQERMTAIVRSVATEREVPLVEMSDYLEELAAAEESAGTRQTVFTNNVHLTNHGAELLARRLAEELRRLSLL